MDKLTIIHWIDAHSVDDWIQDNEIISDELELVPVVSFGIVIGENDRALALAGTHDKGNEKSCCVMILPIGMIVKRQEVEYEPF